MPVNIKGAYVNGHKKTREIPRVFEWRWGELNPLQDPTNTRKTARFRGFCQWLKPVSTV
jgi:hypothetical protein